MRNYAYTMGIRTASLRLHVHDQGIPPEPTLAQVMLLKVPTRLVKSVQIKEIMKHICDVEHLGERRVDVLSWLNCLPVPFPLVWAVGEVKYEVRPAVCKGVARRGSANNHLSELMMSAMLGKWE